MTRRISLITAIGVALAFAAPAFGQGERFAEAPQWHQALQVRSEGLNQKYGLSGDDAYVRALNLRSEALNRTYGPSGDMVTSVSPLDRREQAFAKEQATSALDGREAAFGAKRDAQLATVSGLDVFERTVVASTRETRPIVVDDRFRIDQTPSTVPVSVTNGREIEWPQVGIGLGIGLLLGLGVMLAMRYTRIRPLAH